MKQRRSYILFSAVLILLSITVPSYAEPVVIAVTPFSVKADSSIAFLDLGLIDLFSSRLYLKGKVETVEKNTVIDAYGAPSADPLARIITTGKKTHAHYILTGSLESTPKGVTLNAYVVNMETGKPMLEMTEKSVPLVNSNEIISLVDIISAKINKSLFSRDTAAPVSNKKPETALDVHSHPDKLVKTLEVNKK